jgi:hypothetical protein
VASWQSRWNCCRLIPALIQSTISSEIQKLIWT